MALLEINRNPSKRDLKWFGLVLLLFLVIVGAVMGRASGNVRVSHAMWTLGGTLAGVYYAVPQARRAMFVGWMYLAFPIGYVISHLLLGLIYFALMTPIGLLLRAFGHDAMSRRFDSAASTYWVKRDTRNDVRRYFRQF